MKLRWLVVATMMLWACGAHGSERARPVVAERRGESHGEHDARVNAAVQVRGIEGTLSNFDVRTAMEEHGRDFAACHEPRARALPVLAGRIEFAIQVATDGKVNRVDVRASDLGDRELERCLSEVIRTTQFRAPNGGVANVTWLMALQPASAGLSPETWEAGRVARIIDKNLDDLKAACDLAAAPMNLTVTAYVSARGRVVAVGVASPEGSSDESLDCVAEGLRAWPMPKPHGKYAKVSFVLSP